MEEDQERGVRFGRFGHVDQAVSSRLEAQWLVPGFDRPGGGRRSELETSRISDGLSLKGRASRTDVAQVTARLTRAFVAALAAGLVAILGGAGPAFAGSTVSVTDPAVALPDVPSPNPPPDTTALPGPIPADFWLATAHGDVWAFGHAEAYGSAGATPLTHPVVGITPTPSGKGYWLVASDGGIFAFGDAAYLGSTGGLHLNQPIVAMASTPDGAGYWLVARDGGIFAFGDAAFFGSTGAIHLNQPIVTMASVPDGTGYWLMAADGGVFNFGGATFHGSTAALAAGGGDPAEKLISSNDGNGYWVVDQNGETTAFGDTHGAPAVQGLMFSPTTPGDRAVLYAFQQLGKPYVWGGNGPDGYDCSGLALASWHQGAGVAFARVANNQYHTAGAPVALVGLRAGDLVFWGSSQTDWTSVYHTAMYVGGGRIVEATGDHVQLNSLGQWGDGDLMPHGVRPA